MNPDERRLLEETLKLARENNQALRKMRRYAKVGFVWTVIKIIIVVVPLAIGFFYLQPHFGEIGEFFNNLSQIMNFGRS